MLPPASIAIAPAANARAATKCQPSTSALQTRHRFPAFHGVTCRGIPRLRAPRRNPFDTNYYRRLNSESLNAGSIPQSSGSGAALAAAPVENWEGRT